MFSKARPACLYIRKHAYIPPDRRRLLPPNTPLNHGETFSAKDGEIASLSSRLSTAEDELKKSKEDYRRLFAERNKERWHNERLETELEDLNAEWATYSRKYSSIQSQLDFSRQVNSRLQTDVEHLQSQLVLSTQKIRELEERHGSLRVAPQDEQRGKVVELPHPCSAREKQTIGKLAAAPVSDVNLKAATLDAQLHRSPQKAQSPELEGLQVVKEEDISKLQTIVSARENEYINLIVEVIALKEAQAEIYVLLAKQKKALEGQTTEKLVNNIHELGNKKVALISPLDGIEQQHAVRHERLKNLEKSNAELVLCKQVLDEGIVELKGRLHVQSVSLSESKEQEPQLRAAQAIGGGASPWTNLHNPDRVNFRRPILGLGSSTDPTQAADAPPQSRGSLVLSFQQKNGCKRGRVELE